MATVFETRKRYRVAVYSNDHEPAHVHVVGKGREARFELNCPDGPVRYWDHFGFWKWAELKEIGEEIADRLTLCCEIWSKFHGEV